MVRLERAGPVAGVLVADGATGTGAGAEVWLHGLESGFLASVLLADDGSFSIGPLAPGAYELRVSSPSWFATAESLTLGTGQRVVKNLVARAASSLSGVVVGSDGLPVAGAVIRLDETMPEGSATPIARTGPDGTFVVRQIGTDKEFVLAMIKEELPRVVSQPMRLPAGSRKRGVRLEVDRGSTVLGTIRDRKGVGVAGALVSAMASDGATTDGEVPIATLVADTDGAFRLQLPSGEYSLEFSAAGYATQLFAGVRVDTAVPPMHVVLADAAQLSGHVRRSNGEGVAGVHVSSTSGTTVESTTTDADGSFTLSGVPEGRVELSAMKAEEFISTTKVVTAPSANVVIEVGGGRSLSGRVIRKSSGAPVTEFEIEIASATAEMTSRYASSLKFTDEDGDFSISNPPAGVVQLLVRAEGFAAAKSDRLELDGDKPLDDVVIELEDGGSIQGRVVDSSGIAIPGVEIEPMQQLVPNDPLGAILPLVETQSDNSGSFVIPEVAAGVSRVLFRKAGYRSAERSVTVRGNAARIDVQLSPVGESDEHPSDSNSGSGMPPPCVAHVTGRVAGLAWSEQLTATVGVTTTSGRLSAKVDEAGTFSTDVPGGALSFIAELKEPGRSRSSRTVTISAACGSSNTVDLAFGDVVARGQVRRSGTPVADAMMSFVPVDDLSAPRGEVRLDADGKFELPGLAAIRYVAIVRGARKFESFLAAVDMRAGAADVELAGSRVSGRVVSRATGRPVRGAVVSLRLPAVSGVSLTAITDDAGIFSFDELPQGSYDLTIEHERYEGSAQRIDVGTTDDRILEIQMN